MIRRLGLVIFAVAVCTAVFVATRSRRFEPNPERPRVRWNFLIVTIDTLRYDATTMAGAPYTPFLNSVAAQGVSFARAFSTHDSTPPSHFTLFTGLRNGYGGANDRPDMGLVYQFRARRYNTFGVTANGNLSQSVMHVLTPFQRYSNLYDEWIAMPPPERAKYLPAIDGLLDHYGARKLPWNQAQLFCSGAEVLERLRPMLDGTNEPFFGFVNIIDPHDPYLPTPEHLGREPDSAAIVDPDLRFRKPRYPLIDLSHYPDAAARALMVQRLADAGGRKWSLSDDLSQNDLATYKRRYLASVSDADDILRSIFQQLEHRGVLDRTWVVVVSDHGESFGEAGFVTHSLSDKGDPEASYHVPLVWSAPFPSPGMTVRDDVSLADVAPTIYDLAGIDWSALKAKASGEFGRSLIEYLPVRPGDATATATLGAAPTDAQRKQMNEGALERLRALGYIQ